MLLSFPRPLFPHIILDLGLSHSRTPVTRVGMVRERGRKGKRSVRVLTVDLWLCLDYDLRRYDCSWWMLTLDGFSRMTSRSGLKGKKLVKSILGPRGTTVRDDLIGHRYNFTLAQYVMWIYNHARLSSWNNVGYRRIYSMWWMADLFPKGCDIKSWWSTRHSLNFCFGKCF